MPNQGLDSSQPAMGGEDRGGFPDLDPDLSKSQGGHPDPDPRPVPTRFCRDFIPLEISRPWLMQRP